MHICRTQAPVGQGGLSVTTLAAIHAGAISAVTVVYDCGTLNGLESLGAEFARALSECPAGTDSGRLAHVAASTATGQPAIVILSHVDEDHVNGLTEVIAQLRTRKRQIIVVMPLLTLEQRLFTLRGGSEEVPETHLLFLANPTRYVDGLLGDDGRVVEVESGEGEQEGPVLLSELGSRVPSGTVVTFEGSLDWVLHFVHPPLDREKVGTVAAGLGQEFWDAWKASIELDLPEGATSAIRGSIKTIRNAIKAARFAEGPNETSLVVYSGPPQEACHFGWGKASHPGCVDEQRNYGRGYVPGAIHTGDAPLNREKFYDHVKSELHRYKTQVGTVNLPHHGSREGHNPNLVKDFKPLHVLACSGPRKGWLHPDPDLWASLADQDVCAVHVTKYAGSRFSEWWVDR